MRIPLSYRVPCLTLSRQVGIQGKRYVVFGRMIASAALYVVEPEGVCRVVLVAINMVDRFLAAVMLRIDFLVGRLVVRFVHLDVRVLPLEGRYDFRVYLLTRRVERWRLLSGILSLLGRGHGKALRI